VSKFAKNTNKTIEEAEEIIAIDQEKIGVCLK
jgi:hypothetical protein